MGTNALGIFDERVWVVSNLTERLVNKRPEAKNPHATAAEARLKQPTSTPQSLKHTIKIRNGGKV